MPKLTNGENTAQFFPSFKNPDFLFKLFDFLEEYILTCIGFEFYVAIIGCFLTIAHIFVLTRKSMRISSIVSIMIGIAISDLFSMIVAIFVKHIIFGFYQTDCTPPISLLTYRFFMILQSFRNDVIRCSTWLLVVMAFIRFLALRLATDVKYKRISTFCFGFYATLICYILSSLLSLLSFYRTKLVDNGVWTPDVKCGFPADQIWHTYVLGPSDFSTLFDGFLLRVFNLCNGLLSEILPCILLPISTILLIVEVRNTKKYVTMSVAVRKSTERTTLLIILMTITFFMASLPAGIFTFVQVLYTDVGFLHLSTFVNHFCDVILTLNASTHCIECFIMSSEYRKTVKEVLRFRSKNVVRISSIVF